MFVVSAIRSREPDSSREEYNNAYEKFLSEIRESEKDGDEICTDLYNKCENITNKINELGDKAFETEGEYGTNLMLDSFIYRAAYNRADYVYKTFPNNRTYLVEDAVYNIFEEKSSSNPNKTTIRTNEIVIEKYNRVSLGIRKADIMTKRKKVFCLLNMLVIVLLCACSSEKETGKYVNIPEIEKQIEDTQLNIDVIDFAYDDKSRNIMTKPFTIDSEYFYIFNRPNIKIDLKSGRVQFWCNVPGCVHDELTSKGCMNYVDYCSPVATADGIYYIRGNKVCFYDGEKESAVLENTNYTEFEETMHPDNKEVMGSLIINDDVMYIVCPTYFFTYNLDTKEISEPIKLATSTIFSFCLNDEYICYSTENLELCVFNLETKEITKLDDKVGQACEKDGRFYYVKWNEETPVLYRTESDGSNPQKLIEDCYVNYQVTDSGIYYQSYKTNDCYFYGFDKNSSVKIVLYSGSDEDYVPNCHYIISSGDIDYVFVYDDMNGFVNVFKNGETVGNTIKLGDRYLPTWG